MSLRKVDLVIVGAGPVGLMCAYLANLCGLTVSIADKSSGPLKAGRADALNARSLQLLKIACLFDELYPLGKTCNTSSVWSNGKFLSRQSSWWDAIEGCFHKHFLMIGQSLIEKALDGKLETTGTTVQRETEVHDIQITANKCRTTFSNGEIVESSFVIGADGSRSFVREHFKVPFEITRPQLVWAVIDGVIDTDFLKVPEIIVFQNETSDVAWIPREGDIDRFYVRMDTKEFTLEEAVAKIKRALDPHQISFKQIEWFSRFSVKESVAENFAISGRVFLAGDAGHIHSVNGGQGLNTGLADAFNLIWKIHRVVKLGAPASLLESYERERKPVAKSVVETSAELVRATKFSNEGTHAQEYVDIVQRRAGHITGMGLRYGEKGRPGERLFDFEIFRDTNGILKRDRIYSLLDYSKFTLLIFGTCEVLPSAPDFVKVIHIHPSEQKGGWYTTSRHYESEALLVRPDSYVASVSSLSQAGSLIKTLDNNL